MRRAMNDSSGSETPAIPERHPISEQSRHALKLALADQEKRWRAGTPLAVEKYLEREPAFLSDAEAILDLIYKEVLLRSERGEQPQLDEYVRRFPDHASALRPIFEVHLAFHGAQS